MDRVADVDDLKVPGEAGHVGVVAGNIEMIGGTRQFAETHLVGELRRMAAEDPQTVGLVAHVGVAVLHGHHFGKAGGNTVVDLGHGRCALRFQGIQAAFHGGDVGDGAFQRQAPGIALGVVGADPGDGRQIGNIVDAQTDPAVGHQGHFPLDGDVIADIVHPGEGDFVGVVGVRNVHHLEPGVVAHQIGVGAQEVHSPGSVVAGSKLTSVGAEGVLTSRIFSPSSYMSDT